MHQQDQQYIVRIEANKEKVTLSKAQKEFNRLIDKIEKSSTDLRELRETTQYVHQRMQADYWPLVDQYSQVQTDLVRLFDRAYERNELTRTENKKLASLIRDLAFDLIARHGIDELKPIYDKYDSQGFDKTSAEPGRLALPAYEPKESLETVEAERKAANPKSEKRLAREAKKLVEERNSTKAVRTVYMDLVKAFHPDREPDETEKQRKTGIMHRVTDAYEKGNLLALLRLQLELERIDQTHLENLAENQLNYYNKILRQQAQELDDEVAGLQHKLAALTGKPTFAVNSRIALEFSLNSDIAQLKRTVKQIKADVKALTNIDILKQWLKFN
ncbi:J domain-containing protein [soil metagenome]